MFKRLWFVIVIVASLTVFPSSVALGMDNEPNDSCAIAQDLGAITLPFTFNGELSGSPFPSGDIDFFQFTGTPDTTLRVDLEGASTGMGTLSDPYLGFFDSSCNSIAQNDDGGEGVNSRLAITIPADGIAVLGVTRCCDGGFNEGGLGTYLLSIQEVLPPPNDNFADATPISSLAFDETVDTAAATIEASEPTSSCAYNGPIDTIWYAFTPATSGPISANISNAPFPPSLAAYTGNSLGSLTEVGCRNYGDILTFHADANTTYYFQIGALYPEGGGFVQFHLDVAPPPIAGICFYPSEPSVFQTTQFYDCSYDPGQVGFQSFTWDFGDGATSNDYAPSHQYAADGDYTVQHTVTTVDGRTASTSQVVQVRTRDVSIIKVSAPKSANMGQKKTITVSLRNTRYPENVRIELYKSVPGGFEWVASLTKLVPVRNGNRTTPFSFNYTFTAADAQIGKVTFKVVVIIENGNDAFPADNDAISVPPTVVKGSISYP